MFTACWSLKGGAGTSVVCAGLAIVLRRRRRSGPVLLVDLAGDQPAVLGIPEPSGPGLAEWVAAGSAAPPDALARLEVPVAPGLSLLPRGRGQLDGAPPDLLVQLLATGGRSVVVDCGTLDPWQTPHLGQRVASEATRSLLVTRSCHLALRRAARSPVHPSGVVVVREPGRVLGDPEIATALTAPLVASVGCDPAVARAVDSGLLVSRLPRRFAEVVGALA
jgi:hypothetical protein